MTAPERLSVPEELRLRPVSQGGPSDLEVWLEANPQAQRHDRDPELAALSDLLYEVQERSGFDPMVCQAVDDLLAAIEAAR